MLAGLPALLSSLWQPTQFYLACGLRCAWQFEAEQKLPWELFRGRLLDRRHTREAKTFLTWNLLPVDGGAVGNDPLLSLLLDETTGEIHVTRGVLCRVWTPIDSAGGIESEQSTAWVRELVGTLKVEEFSSAEALGREIRCLIGLAIVGVSRLPLASLEAPLPQFTFGQLAYVPRYGAAEVDPRMPRRTWLELIASTWPADLDEAAAAKLLEILLRSAATNEIHAIASTFAESFGTERLVPTFRRMFNDVSLSPYTDFVDHALLLLAEWTQGGFLGVAVEIDTLAWLMRQITRHLTAYDLVLFHYRGANFPDALLLDVLLRRFCGLVDQRADRFTQQSAAGRRHRRALRMGCLLRFHYEGHAVPDQPTSPGENARVFPEPYQAVPDEQIDQPHRRTRRLYEDCPLAALMTPALRDILTLACLDLTDDAELREGGVGLFIDRPLGFFKAPAEIDQTPLLSYEAFSRRLATRRLLDAERLANHLGLDVPAPFWHDCRERLLATRVAGLSLDRVPDSPRPAVSLADARKVADDFVIRRTTPRSLRTFCEALAIEPGPWTLVARALNEAGQSVLLAFDESGRLCAEFDGDWSLGSKLKSGVEIPRAGLRFTK
jgi:hypothetical protein